MSTVPRRRLTAEEYLRLEQESNQKHEFYQGEIFAMAGASSAHNLLVASITRVLGNALLDRDCLVFPSDMRVLLPSGLYTYPDASVVCGPAILERRQGAETLTNPLLIIEVLSHSTAAYDRGWKFEQYQCLSSLQGYLLVAQDRQAMEHFQRNDMGDWTLTAVEGSDAELPLPELSLTLSLTEIYRKVELSSHARPGESVVLEERRELPGASGQRSEI